MKWLVMFAVAWAWICCALNLAIGKWERAALHAATAIWAFLYWTALS